MSTELITGMQDHQATRFWGGEDRGSMLQITSKKDSQFLQLTLLEAASLVATLNEHILHVAKQRQEYLAEQLKEIRSKERTIFNEVHEIKSQMITGCVQVTSIRLIDQFCPKGPAK